VGDQCAALRCSMVISSSTVQVSKVPRCFLETSDGGHPVTRRHISEERIPHLHLCDVLKNGTLLLFECSHPVVFYSWIFNLHVIQSTQQ